VHEGALYSATASLYSLYSACFAATADGQAQNSPRLQHATEEACDWLIDQVCREGDLVHLLHVVGHHRPLCFARACTRDTHLTGPYRPVVYRALPACALVIGNWNACGFNADSL
jgi:hypothetical protein